MNNNKPVLREPRVRKLVKIEILLESSQTHDAMVRNLSTFGLRAKTSLKLQTGQHIQIKKTGFGKVSGVVRWVNGSEFGMQFDEPIKVDLFNFGDSNSEGHFVTKIDNGHVWRGFNSATSSKRPGFRKK